MKLAHRIRPSGERGLAIVIVILVLAALLVLCTPFLLSSRNADQASRQLFDRGESRIALDTASRHGRTQLSGSHPAAVETDAGFESLDETPWHDSLDEVTVTNRFETDFYNANDPNGVMWDLDVEDLSGRVDMNSAPPQMFANLMSLYSRLPRPIKDDAKEIRISPIANFSAPSIIWIGGEYIRVREFEKGTYDKLMRGFGARYDGDDNPLPGPRPPSGHPAGAIVLDQRAFAPVLWRIENPQVGLKHFDAMEQISDAAKHVWMVAISDSIGLNATDVRALRKHCSVFAGVSGGREWQRPVRLTSPYVGDETHAVTVDRPRFFNEGCTIKITDGFNTEYAVIQRIAGRSRLVLDRPLVNDYEAWETVISALSRRPVNINTATKELIELLILNLQVRGQNERIVSTEAQLLAELIVETRPFTGHEDFLRRVVLPAAGIEELPDYAEIIPDVFAQSDEGFISPLDAYALYVNALNANDLTLSFSTMPFCYTSRDTYKLSMRSSVNAKSGVERATALREEVLHVVPQRELFSIWSLQEQFDESMRLDREAPYWATGPRATTRYDFTAIPPSRLWPHLGAANGQRWLPGVVADPNLVNSPEPPVAEHVFADREEQGYLQLWNHRMQETARLQGRMLHFDQETRDPEGRYLPDETVQYSTDDPKVQWTDPSEALCRPLYFSLWFKPQSLANATILDVAGTNLPDVDRVQLLMENGDLVLRVLDGMGDHPASTVEEAGELRYALVQGDGPGLPIETWNHIAIDVRGNRADQMTMLVNGLNHGVTSPGYSYLTGSVGPGVGVVRVESLLGFRQQGCMRIGEELLEYIVDNSGAVSVQRQETGRLAGFGGRNARVRFTHEKPDIDGPTASTPMNIGAIDLAHASDTPAEQYGYSLPIASNIPFGGSALNGDLGLFRVGRLIGVENGQTSQGDPITIEVQDALGNPFPWQLGLGIEGSTSTATGLILESADAPGSDDSTVMEGFSQNGGYAAVMTVVEISNQFRSLGGAPIGGIEIIRYTGYTGNVLQIGARGDAVSELQLYPEQDDGNARGGARAFVAMWDSGITVGDDGQQLLNNMYAQTFVFPISIAAPGADDLTFLTPSPPAQGAGPGISEFAQLTRIDDAEFTEWVRYDEIVASNGQLVRDDLFVLEEVQELLGGGQTPPVLEPPQFPPGGPGGGGGPGGIELSLENAVATSAPKPTSAVPAAKTQSVGGPDWLPVIGQEENDYDNLPLSRGVADQLQFRGVMGTYIHRQPSGTQILPVFHLQSGSVSGDADMGEPGRLDPIFMTDGSPPYDDLGWSGVIHWAHRPAQFYYVRGFEQTDASMLSIQASGSPPVQEPHIVSPQLVTYAALQRGAQAPMTFAQQPTGSQQQIADARRMTRIVMHPSGEMPRVVATASVGVDRSGGFIPSALADEVVFGDTLTPQTSEYALADTRGAGVILLEEFIPGSATTVRVTANAFRTDLGRLGTTTEVLSTWPQDAGLVRIGSEILAYSALDASNGTITIAQGGRALLGSLDQNHEAGSPIYLLENFEVTLLGGSIGPADGAIPLGDLTNFPTEGTVLIDQELIHYTRVRGNLLEMPFLSEEPGAMDRGGGGMFRGRYGTIPAPHTTGTPVIVFPFRYWDRWEHEADAPELSYFGLIKDELGAFWREMFMLNQETSAGGSRLGVLVRTNPDVPWDANPDDTPGLDVIYPDDLRDNWAGLSGHSDRIEWRVFVDYTPGAFDALTGQSHGWRQTPRLDALGVRYLAPTVSLRSVEE